MKTGDHGRSSPTLVIGLGNPIRGDDGVGWRSAERLRTYLGAAEDIDVDTLAMGGLRLMERMLGYDRVVLIDAVATGRMPRGNVRVFPLEAFTEQDGGHVTNPHDTSLTVAIDLAQQLGAHVPESIEIVGVETSPDFTFSETLSPDVARSVSVAAAYALEIARAVNKEARCDIT